jgi:hypothetical protein
MAIGHLTAKEITKSNISKNFADAHSFYIGAVVADGFRARGYALASLRSYLVNECRIHDKPIYARAATADGLRLLERTGFRPAIQEQPTGLGALYVINYNPGM